MWFIRKERKQQKIRAVIRGVDTNVNVVVTVIEENSQTDPAQLSRDHICSLTTMWLHCPLISCLQTLQPFLSFPSINSKARSFDFTLGTVKTQQV